MYRETRGFSAAALPGLGAGAWKGFASLFVSCGKHLRSLCHKQLLGNFFIYSFKDYFCQEKVGPEVRGPKEGGIL